MFDFHIHSDVSFDSKTPAIDIARAAAKNGMREICFTDHWDYLPNKNDKHDIFSLDDYAKAYDSLKVEGLTVRRGIELGFNEWNTEDCESVLKKRNFDFVIGSVHYADGIDPYFPEYWEGKDVNTAYMRYLEQELKCIKVHNDFDVLGHLTYVCKSPCNPFHAPLRYDECADIADEIMRILVSRGKGMEINTSGVDRGVDFIPSADFLKRFRELGGEIVTIGSDAHDDVRVGQHCSAAMEIAKDIFGYVCTFENRQPVFHKL